MYTDNGSWSSTHITNGMLMSSHASVRFIVVCAHLSKLLGPRESFEGVVDFEGERFGSRNSEG
jgi:hypothetical protein